MNKIILLDRLVEFTDDALKDLTFPVAPQKEDHEPAPRHIAGYKMRLPDSKSYKRKAPYYIHQIITGNDVQPKGEQMTAQTVVRTIICIYCADEQEGAMHLLNIMERLRIALLKKQIIGQQYKLDVTSGIETMIYTNDTAPYYGGEMITTWDLPPVRREEPNLCQ
jgi:hypothetical protein